MSSCDNPYRPGAGHVPPHMAGRHNAQKNVAKHFSQAVVTDNVIVSGPRGVGKTVLLETLVPIARSMNWSWVGTDFTEQATLTEENLANRLITDLSVKTSTILIDTKVVSGIGFNPAETKTDIYLTYQTLSSIYNKTAGLVSDKLKATLEIAWQAVEVNGGAAGGIVFAYDEAHIISNQDSDKQYPVSLLLDVFQSLQKKGAKMMLLLSGLPNTFSSLIDARTYAERMFKPINLDRLKDEDAKRAILKPLEDMEDCPVMFDDHVVEQIVEMSQGYPYFIQYICREVYDLISEGAKQDVPVEEIEVKLAQDFFFARWSRASERQKELLSVIAQIPGCDDQFTFKEIVEVVAATSGSSFSESRISQLLKELIGVSLVFKSSHGKYSFEVPLFGRFIRRQNFG